MRVLRKLLVFLGLLVLGGLVLLAGILAWGHWTVRQAVPPLPDAAELLRAAPGADLPVRLSYINSASQVMSRSGVLDPALDPDPEAPYVMAHPAFVLEWADGRLFLIDVGMDRETAISFGAPLELAAGGEPIEPHVAVVEALGDRAPRVAGVAFTHLHVDHVAGLAGLCGALAGGVPIYWTPFQSESRNHTTWPARGVVDDAGCAELRLLGDGPLYEVPGFPGLSVVVAGGHTPGSQVFVARVREGGEVRTSVLTGDVVNQIDGVRHDVPKPGYYSLLVVPENAERLSQVRAWLRALERDHRVRLLVSHDRRALEQAGLPAYASD